MKVMKKCLVCDEVFETYDVKGGRGMRVRPKRRKKGITCSKGCSKRYQRIYQYIMLNVIKVYPSLQKGGKVR